MLDDYAAELTFDNLVADAVGVLDALGIDQAAVLGHSYGGFIAQPLAAAHPDRISKLILANTVPAFDYAPEPSGSDDALGAFGELFSGPTAERLAGLLPNAEVAIFENSGHYPFREEKEAFFIHLRSFLA